jgi:hypothetical protein
MQHPCPPQVGLRRSRPGRSRDRAAFWAGIVIVAAFEAMLMARFAPPDWNPTFLVASSDADAGQDSN